MADSNGITHIAHSRGRARRRAIMIDVMQLLSIAVGLVLTAYNLGFFVKPSASNGALSRSLRAARNAPNDLEKFMKEVPSQEWNRILDGITVPPTGSVSYIS